MKEKTSLVFTGDIGFDKYMDGKWDDEDLISLEVMEFLKSGDHRIVNVEGPLTEASKVTKPNGVVALTHTQNPEAVKFLNRIGADVWNICNNHIMDAGALGVLDTRKRASKSNAVALGAGMNLTEASTPLIFKEAGGIGLLSVGYERACRQADSENAGCLNFSDMKTIYERISSIKKENRWCIVIAHDGEEFTSLPSPYTRDRYMSYLDMGADIVVAHHPHVPMNYETVGDKVIFYSLGNFVFDTDYQRSQFNTEKGIVLKINLSEDSFSFESMGILIDREKEKVVKGELPKIFEDVQPEEYEKLLPLSSKQFIEATKRQLRYLNPDKFRDATESDFIDNFYEPLRSGRVPGKLLDMQIVYPLSLKVANEDYKKTKLLKVFEYINEQL